MAPVVRHLVLDNEAVNALLTRPPGDVKRRRVIAAISAANGTTAVPAAVRAEAGWDRRAAASANANRLVPSSCDRALDGAQANRVVQLRALVPSASVVDASVAAVAEVVGASGGTVEVLTSDVPDLTALAAHGAVTMRVVPL